jgi:ABC-type protease/lipase transport system fused ATPase/permease subunit
MQKEFIDDSNGNKGLIICAADRTADGQTGACHIMLGGRAVNVALLASMMQQGEMQDLFRKARILSSTDGSNGYMADELRRLRSRLNRDYAFLVLPIGYSLLLAVLTAISPVFHLSTTIASVLLMVFLTMLIVRDIKDLRRKTRRLADSIDDDRRERRNMLGAAMMGMLAQMTHRDRDDDDE